MSQLLYKDNLSTTAQIDLLVVLIHGYGANCQDLQPIINACPRFKFASWILPQAPKKTPFNMGYQWFPIDFASMERAYTQGKYKTIWQNIPEEFLENIDLLYELIKSKATSYKALVIGGFSQGAMCATHLVRTRSFNIPTYLLNMSGGICAQDLWYQGQFKPSSYFHSHGKTDDLIPFISAQSLAQSFKDWDWLGENFFFNGGHEISYTCLEKVNQWLEKNFS